MKSVWNFIEEYDNELILGEVLKSEKKGIFDKALLRFEKEKRELLAHRNIIDGDLEAQKNLLIEKKNEVADFLTSSMAIPGLALLDTSLKEIKQIIKSFVFLPPSKLIILSKRLEEHIELGSSVCMMVNPTDQLDEFLFFCLDYISGTQKIIRDTSSGWNTINFLAYLNAKSCYYKWITEELNVLEPQNATTKEVEIFSDLKWLGEAETEFVQFAYALFHSSLLKNESDQITKFVPSLAQVLNFPLGKNWIDNHSKSINRNNDDYKPKIFETLKEGYEKFVNETKSKKK